MTNPAGQPDRIGYRGDRRRERPELEINGLPFKGRVVVTPVQLPRRGWVFETKAEWTGPPLPGSGFVGAGEQSDLTYLDELDRALRIANAAAAELRKAQPPDLRRLARAA